MSEWVAVQDPSTGRTYYANMRTQETSWEVPPGFVGSETPAVTYGQSQMGFSDAGASGYGGSFYGAGAGAGAGGAGSFYGGAGGGSYYGGGAGGGGSFYGGGAGGGAVAAGGGYGGSFYGAGAGAGAGAGGAVAAGGGAAAASAEVELDPSSPWQKAHDPSSGRDYYYHVETKETRWTLPEDAILLGAGHTAAAPATGRPSAMGAAAGGVGMMPARDAFGTSEAQIQTAWDSSSSGEVEDSQEDSWAKEDSEEEESSSDGGLMALAPGKAMIGKTDVVSEPSTTDSEEKVQSFAPIADDEDVVIEDDSDKYWMLGETQGDKYPMEEFAKKHFQVEKHKKGLLKKRSISELLSYCPFKKMDCALTRMDAKLNVQAKQIWKNVCSYMGERKSGKDDVGHVDKLLRFALKAPEELRDEIYCQLVKQTTRNPKESSLLKAWNLMCLCASTFPPGDEFACYLAAYLYSRTKEAGRVAAKAEYSLRALDRSMEAGQRRLQPDSEEMKRIEQMEPIDIRVYFLDGTFRNLKITSQTRAMQVEESLAKAFGMKHGESFGIFEVEDPEIGWENDVYAKREPMTTQEKIDDLIAMPLDRELEANERVMDVVTSWKKSTRKKDKFIRFSYKCKLYSKAQESGYSRYEWRIAFITAVWHVIHGLYVVHDEALILRLAALQLQGLNGPQEDSFYVPGVIVASVERYVPWTVRKKYSSASELEKMILEKHLGYKHLDKVDAYRKYIEMLRKDASPEHFGYSFFRAVRVSRMKKAKVDRDDLVIGVGEGGMILCEPKTMLVYERYKMEEILTYGFRNNAFLVVAGSLMTQKKFQFATMLGKQMNDLLAAHIDLRVQQAEIQGFKIGS